MEEKYLEQILQLLERLLSNLYVYEKQTDQMVSADLIIIQDVLLSRNSTMAEMKADKEKISQTLQLLPVKQQPIITGILQGATPDISKLSDLEREVYYKMRTIHSIQQGILSKDFQITAKVKEDYESIKKELEELQKDKKKIDYYSVNSLGGKGGSLDSHM